MQSVIVKTMFRHSSSRASPPERMAVTLADTLQSVELADGVEIHLRVAGPAARSTAWLIDAIIYVLVMIVVLLTLLIATGFAGFQVIQGVFLLLLFLINWFYNVFFEISRHAATPGQRVMRLRVASVSGGPVRLPQSLIRNLLRVVDFMPFGYLFGLTCCLFSGRFQRLGDLVADTVVVYAEPDQNSAATPVQVNADPMAPPQALTRAEQAALADLLERAPRWSDARKVELADLLEPLTQRTGMAGLEKVCAMGMWIRQGGAGD